MPNLSRPCDSQPVRFAVCEKATAQSALLDRRANSNLEAFSSCSQLSLKGCV